MPLIALDICYLQLCIHMYNMNLVNGYKEFHKIYYAGGYGGDKSI